MKIVVDNAIKQQAVRLLLAALALLLSVLLGVRIAPDPDAVLCPPCPECPECPTVEPTTTTRSLSRVVPDYVGTTLTPGQCVSAAAGLEAGASCGL